MFLFEWRSIVVIPIWVVLQLILATFTLDWSVIKFYSGKWSQLALSKPPTGNITVVNTVGLCIHYVGKDVMPTLLRYRAYFHRFINARGYWQTSIEIIWSTGWNMFPSDIYIKTQCTYCLFSTMLPCEGKP